MHQTLVSVAYAYEEKLWEKHLLEWHRPWRGDSHRSLRVTRITFGFEREDGETCYTLHDALTDNEERGVFGWVLLRVHLFNKTDAEEPEPLSSNSEEQAG